MNARSAITWVALAGLVAGSAIEPAAGATVAMFREGDGGAFSNTDATCIQGNAGFEDTNLGNSSTLYVENDPGDSITRALIRFPDIFGPLAGQIPVGSTINSATLTVSKDATTFHGSSNTLTVHQVLTDWDEDTVTWNSFNMGGLAGVDYVALELDSFVPLPETGEAMYDLDVTQAVQSWSTSLAGAIDNHFGVILINPGVNVAVFQSDDSGSTNLRPMLTVEFVPPATVPAFPRVGMLLLAALLVSASLVAVRKRRPYAA